MTPKHFFMISDSFTQREMPVFGFVHDEAVVGIIVSSCHWQFMLGADRAKDEVTRIPVPPPPRPSPSSSNGERKRARPAASVQTTPSKARRKKMAKNESSPPPTQRLLTDFLEVASFSASSGQPPREIVDLTMSDEEGHIERPCTPPPRRRSEIPPSFCLHILDTKTRRYPTMPQVEDTLSTRLQLMLYRRLLLGMVYPPPLSSAAVEFGKFFEHLRLSRTRSFSAKFQEDAQLPPEMNCLQKLETCWRAAVEMLHVDGIDESMTVEYRLQQSRVRKPAGRRKKELAAEEQEKENIARAVAASLADAAKAAADGVGSAVQSAVAASVAEPCVPAPSSLSTVQTSDSEKFADNLAAQPGGDVLQLSEDKLTTANADDPSSDSEPEIGLASGIIGTKRFRNDDGFLDAHLTDVLQFWHGERPPRGVDVTLTRRCRYVGCGMRNQVYD